MKKAYRDWREEKEEKEKYKLLIREFRELCKRKEEVRLERIEEEIRNCRTETQIWKIINKERKRVAPIQEDISMEEWKRHFMRLLEGSEKDKREEAEKRNLEGDQEEDIRDEEIEEQIKKLKKKKAAGTDGIESEVWRYIAKDGLRKS